MLGLKQLLNGVAERSKDVGHGFVQTSNGSQLSYRILVDGESSVFVTLPPPTLLSITWYREFL